MDIDDIYLAGKNAAYDSAAKKLLASRKILAWILKYCVEEFKESEIADIRDRYIIGTPEVALTPVLPDQTNALSHIRGESTEDATLTEGRVTCDTTGRSAGADHQCGSAEKFTPDISLDEARRVLLQPADFVTIHCGLRESALRRCQEGLQYLALYGYARWGKRYHTISADGKSGVWGLQRGQTQL